MASYNKPGVYIEESLTPNLPGAAANTPSTAAFIGYSDRGPTSGTDGSSIVGVPTLVNSWSDFVDNFSFGSSLNTFSGVSPITLTGASSSAAVITVTGASSVPVGSVVSVITGTGTIVDGTIVTAVAADGSSVTLSTAPSVALSGATVKFTPSTDLKYAVKTFFENGGGQAYILRDVNPAASYASLNIRDMNGSITLANTTSFDGNTGFSTGVIKITAASGTPFSSAVAGKRVTISGVTDSNYTFLNNNTWVVSTATNTVLTILANNGTASTSATSITTGTSPVTITGNITTSSTTDALQIKAKGAGTWGNNVWVGVYPNASSGYFDIEVWYAPTATSYSDLTDSTRVERFTYLSMDSSNARYFVDQVRSQWITVTDPGSPATGSNRLPAFTGRWGYTTSSSNISTVNNSFTWNITSFSKTSGPGALRLGTTAVNVIETSAQSAGREGNTMRDGTTVPTWLDAIDAPLLLNWAGNTKSNEINALLKYAGETRGTGFVVIDSGNSDLATTLGTVSGIGKYSQYTNFGASYYPYISIPDPGSTTGKVKTVSPSGAVMALYVLTDSQRGVFKAPAGAGAVIRNAVSVPALSNADFTSVSSNSTNLNIIRFIPGSGICVMGARTLSNSFIDRYVPVRRSLNYLAYTLRASTMFAVFEPNDAQLRRRVSSLVQSILYDFWRKGGLSGNSASDAYYVKCDSTNNSDSAISAGELHIEVGVALQRPAEFVVIRIGQLDGGSTVTTTL